MLNLRLRLSSVARSRFVALRQDFQLTSNYRFCWGFFVYCRFTAQDIRIGVCLLCMYKVRRLEDVWRTVFGFGSNMQHEASDRCVFVWVDEVRWYIHMNASDLNVCNTWISAKVNGFLFEHLERLLVVQAESKLESDRTTCKTRIETFP